MVLPEIQTNTSKKVQKSNHFTKVNTGVPNPALGQSTSLSFAPLGTKVSPERAA